MSDPVKGSLVIGVCLILGLWGAGWNVGERYKLNSKNEMSVFDAKTGTVYFADSIWRLDDKGLESEETKPVKINRV
jgi:hypothetical protein